MNSFASQVRAVGKQKNGGRCRASYKLRGGHGVKASPLTILVSPSVPHLVKADLLTAAVNPTLTYVKVRHRDHLYYLAKGAFTAKRLEDEFKRKEWVDGVPKLKSLEQLFREKGGYEIDGEVSGASLIGGRYDGPFDELPAQGNPGGYPAHVAGVHASAEAYSVKKR